MDSQNVHRSTCHHEWVNFTDDLVQLRFLQGLIPVDLFHRFFYFLKRFPSDSESANKIADRRHGVFRRGWREEGDWRARYSQSADPCAGGGQNKSCWSCRPLQLIFYHATSPVNGAPATDPLRVLSKHTSYMYMYKYINIMDVILRRHEYEHEHKYEHKY